MRLRQLFGESEKHQNEQDKSKDMINKFPVHINNILPTTFCYINDSGIIQKYKPLSPSY